MAELIETQEFIDGHIKAILDAAPKRAAMNDVLLPNRLREGSKKSIQKTIEQLKKRNDELRPFVQHLKEKIPDITAKTRICATYLLLAEVSISWEGIFALAERGMSTQLMNVLRSINESLSLVKYFALLPNDQDSHLIDWFNGTIVTPGEEGGPRDTIANFFQNSQDAEVRKVDFKKMDSTIYRVESKYTHPTYLALLESVSIFTKDFDWLQHSHFHFTEENLKYGSGKMNSFTITIKAVYQSLARDRVKYEELSAILSKYMSQPASQIMEYVKNKYPVKTEEQNLPPKMKS